MNNLKLKLLVSGSCTSICLALFGYQFINIKKKWQLIQDFVNAIALGPSEIPTDQFKQCKELKQLKESPKNLLIKGILSSVGPIQSKFSNKQLIYQIIQKVDIFSNEELLGQHYKKRIKQQINAAPNFLISDSQQNCKVYKNTAIKNLVQTCSATAPAQKQYLNLNWFDKLRTYYYFLIQVMAIIMLPMKQRTSIFSVPGIKIGFEEQELGIEIGENCMLFGKIIYNFETKELKMPNPQIILKDKIDIVRGLKKNLYLTIMGTVGIVAISSFCFYQTIRLLKQFIRLQKSVKQEIAVNPSQDYKCILCKDQKCDLILNPCKHIVICKACYDGLKKKKCPHCKQKIRSIDNFYLP